MAISKLIPFGLGVTLVIIFGFTMWKKPVRNLLTLGKKYLKIKSKGASKRGKKKAVSVTSCEDDLFDDATDFHDETDDEFHDALEAPLSQLNCNDIFNMVDSLNKKDGNSQLEALEILKKYEIEFGFNDPNVLWRIAESLRNMSVIEKTAKNTIKQNELLFEAKKYAKKAMDLDDTNAHAHKWYGLLSGEMAEHLSLREQVIGAKIFKDHLQIAYEIIPDDYLINYALGRFEYEASSRSYIERAAAKLVFGKLFDASQTTALSHLMASEYICPSKYTRYFIAKCYLYDDKLPTAHDWILKAIELPINTPDDYVAEQEILAFRDSKFRTFNL